ncbi:phosphoribosylaminoimidazolesuccinocarboxamide synthase [uncultured Ruminococcus sp.]|uniref:phosphoribosylaminoimidazolesuccinocarboxamide synthase n=1 Tax=uncultured Ruminococcus sp. TaxID=165186 RepID=UPI0025CF5B01|nr:phosphoribosylaminoimidazolesuccinocarboxamide synthase [uncultured Ruminococcus sp.]
MKKIISGKVREVYETDEGNLVMVTTDRISAFDVILNSTVPNKGKALNQISLYWFDLTKDIIPNHVISSDLADMPNLFAYDKENYEGRTILTKKLKMLPYEFIVRGYMFGSMWAEYKESKTFCGKPVEGEYVQAQKLAEPIVTPSVKNNEGHDENITMDRLRAELGAEEADRIADICVKIYNKCYDDAKAKGLIIADTKFEFGYDENGVLTLGDEVMTPDSSRFWAADDYKTGVSPRSYDKQFVRDWLIENKLNGVTPAPELPAEIVENTAKLYKECFTKITGKADY